MAVNLKKHQRLLFIIDQLAKKQRVRVKSLAKLLNITERTIRNDLKELQENGICELFYGGAEFSGSLGANMFRLSGVKEIMNGLNTQYTETAGKQNDQTDHADVYILGSFNIDIVSEVASFPKNGQTVRGKSTNFYAGGKGANQATAAAKVNENVHFTTKIGNDEFNAMAKTYLGSTNIKSVSLFEDNETHTGNAIIIVNTENADNFITINPGANEKISEAELLGDQKILNNSKIFLTQLENNFDITEKAVKLAKAKNLTVILNPAPYLSEVNNILPYIDILTPNETEASDITGVNVTNVEEAKLAAEKIFTLGVKKVIITLSSQGCLYFDGDKHLHFPAFKALPIDTSGAGDSFNGALAGALANGDQIEYAIKYASAFASLAVERKGASNMPDHKWVLQRIETENNYSFNEI